jgi:hypothetical protein
LANPPKETLLTVAWVGFSEYVAEFQLRELEAALTQALADNPARQTVQILPFLLTGMPEMDMATQSRLSVLVSLSEIDAFIGTFAEGWYGEFMMDMAPFWAFGDIAPVAEQAGVTSPSFIYYEGDDALAPPPRAIFINDSAPLTEMGIWTENLYFAVITGTRRRDAAAAALTFLLPK